MGRQWAAMILAVFLAGCVSVKSPEKVQIQIGGGDGQADKPSEHREHQAYRDEPPNREQSAAASERTASPRRKSKWDVAADAGGMIVGEGTEGYIFYAFDALALPGRPVELRARVKAYKQAADLKGMTIQFRRVDGPPVGRAITNAEGYATFRWRPPKPGQYRFLVKIVAVNGEENRPLLKLPAALLLVEAAKMDAAFVVVDLDRTLVAGNFLRVVLWDGGKVMPGSVRAMQRIAERYGVIYLTQRPGDLTRTSRLWLENEGFPDGVLVLGTAMGMLGDGGELKSQRLREIRRDFPDLRFGVGDKESDVEAYLANGMKAIWIPRVKDKPKNLRKLAQTLRRRREKDIVVVEDWTQIERAILGRYTCSTGTFADLLDRRAEVLQRHQDEKKRKKDDDDDD